MPNIFTIGEKNPHVGDRVRVEWIKRWGGQDPGCVVIGTLIATFATRCLIGEVMAEEIHNWHAKKSSKPEIWRPNNPRKISTPWSRNYISVDILGPGDAGFATNTQDRHTRKLSLQERQKALHEGNFDRAVDPSYRRYATPEQKKLITYRS